MYVHDASGMIAASQRDLPPFRLFIPDTLDEALDAVAGEPDPVPYAGGTDLCAGLREGRTVGALVWLRKLGELRQIERKKEALSVGAMVTHADGAGDSATAAIPGLAAAWRRIGNVRVRMAATIGGNLMARRTGYEMSIILSALDARLHFDGKSGESRCDPAALWHDTPDERRLLSRIEIPLKSDLKLDYDRSLRPVLTQATATWREADGALRARTVIATPYLIPFAYDVDPALDDDALAETASQALPDDFADPATGNGYLRHAGAVLLRRQLGRLGQVHG